MAQMHRIKRIVTGTGTSNATANTETAHAHGMGETPDFYLFLSSGTSHIYESKAADSTSIYSKSPGTSITFNWIAFTVDSQ